VRGQILHAYPARPFAKKKSARVCCIVGCTSRDSKNPDLSFYSFPGKPWECERRKKWIVAVRRITYNLNLIIDLLR